ncbi:hypothetical protein [Clostridium gasigenes]|uniref:hypothetical protein n=1 Tax=Clostridium gasigenes TaxID=94869 RepID=UPI001FACA42E|nr:hypothetical protein [Clostridium gasigenes]
MIALSFVYDYLIVSSSRSNDLLVKLSKNANMLEINNIVVPGVISNKISENIIITILEIVIIGLVNTRISEDLTIAIFVIVNLLINIYIYGVINKTIMVIEENKHVDTKLYFDV